MRQFEICNAVIGSYAVDRRGVFFSVWPQPCPLRFTGNVSVACPFVENGYQPFVSITEKCSHWAYQQIIRMGKAVVPLLLHENSKRIPIIGFLLFAKSLVQTRCPSGVAGKLVDMASAWLQWARDNGVFPC